VWILDKILIVHTTERDSIACWLLVGCLHQIERLLGIVWGLRHHEDVDHTPKVFFWESIRGFHVLLSQKKHSRLIL
jgi:hypothetical protein